MDAQPFVTWAAPIVAALATCAGQLALNARFKMADEKRDSARAETQAKRDAEAAWRDSVETRLSELEARLSEQDGKIDTVLRGQTTQMRSDLVHRAHRYIDDLHAASTDEKQAFWAEYEDYVAICEANGITNSFIDNIAQQVMDLPNRS